MTASGEEFSPGMQQLLAGRERRLGARLAASQQEEEEQRRQEEETRLQNAALVADGQKAAGLAAEKNVPSDVTVHFDDGPVACWRLQWQESYEKLRELAGGYYDHEAGVSIPQHYESVSRVTGTDEMLLIPRNGLWIVRHRAYMKNSLGHDVPHDTIVDAFPCSDTNVGGRYADVATKALFNFLDNNKLVPYAAPGDGAQTAELSDASAFPTLRAARESSRSFERLYERREHTLRIVEVGVADMVRDIGRLALWTVEQLQQNDIEPDIEVDTVTRRSSTFHAGGVREVKRHKLADGWKLWPIPRDERIWALLPDARVIKCRPEDSTGIILNTDPDEVTLDFSTGDINDGASGPLDRINSSEQEVMTLLNLCGVNVDPKEAQWLINQLYPDIGHLISRARATADWQTAFDGFAIGKRLQPAPPDL